MIDRKLLLDDLQRLLKKIEADLRERSDEPEIAKVIKAEYETAKAASRTAETYEAWRSAYITQIAAAWVLSTVFVRFLEDNQLIDPPMLSGPGDRLQRARDEYDLYVDKAPSHSVREYLLYIFDEMAKLPGGREVFGEHNPVHAQRNWISGDAAKELRNFWQELSPATGDIVHNFTDADWDTRFLGDLYQDISEAARKKYALLQTPDFVEEFILDRTLEPALDEFGLNAPPVVNSKGEHITKEGFRMIDPACGSGHFLLGAFPRILDRWRKREPGTNVRELVQRTLDSIHGVDINPFAIAIARFRLLLAALAASGETRLADAPAFQMNLACGDSLYHGVKKQQVMDFTDESHYFRTEDAENLRRILQEGTFHAVVANPPYITPKDRAARDAYKRLYKSCYMKYSLAVPFMERIFRLAIRGKNAQSSGFVGQITANSFMKREFGKKLIEEFFETVELTHLVDTSVAYVPGHGTPTLILFGRNRSSRSRTIRTLMGIRREPGAPEDPSKGLVWMSIIAQMDQAGSESDFISASDTDRTRFLSHPWTIAGGGAAELKSRLDKTGKKTLRSFSESIGVVSFTLEDEIFIIPKQVARRSSIEAEFLRAMVAGDAIRDWEVGPYDVAVFPYDDAFKPIDGDDTLSCMRHLWLARTNLSNNKMFGGKTKVEVGYRWYEFGRLTSSKLKAPRSIVTANVASHNHFVFDTSRSIFNVTAPIVKLYESHDDIIFKSVTAVLNSSVASFWMKQVFQAKGGSGINQGVYEEQWERYFQSDAAKLSAFPLADFDGIEGTAIALHSATKSRFVHRPSDYLARWKNGHLDLEKCRAALLSSLGEMIRLQEDLDWECYRLYGLLEEDLPYADESLGIQLGERAFEIVLARKIARGEVQTTWFERHGSQPITELPSQWPDDYKQLVQRRIEVIESNPQIALIEQPEYKRRWNTTPWEEQVQKALKTWLLDRLESYFDFDGRMNDDHNVTAHSSLTSPAVISIAQLADIAAKDEQFIEVAEVYRDRSDFDVVKLVAELVAEEHVPLLPILRYTSTGLDKRTAWERTWELQRAEDAIDARIGIEGEDGLTEDQAKTLKKQEIGDIPVPPKYASKDFISTGGVKYWKLRGKLDVPKERWISFPHCEGDDQTLPIAWAGYDHLQQVQAISAYFAEVQEKGGSDDPRLVPLLGCIQQLIPWLKQWHNDIHPEFGYRLGDYFEGFVKDEARTLGLTVEDVQNWEPPKKAKKPKTKAKPK